MHSSKVEDGWDEDHEEDVVGVGCTLHGSVHHAGSLDLWKNLSIMSKVDKEYLRQTVHMRYSANR